MTDIERMNDKAVEIENQIQDLRANIRCISEYTISLSEILGTMNCNLYDLMSMLDELNDIEFERGDDVN